MSIELPKGLPAKRILLAEGIQVSNISSTSAGARRPLRVALLNLMPRKEVTETQIARLLGDTPMPVSLTLFLPDSYQPKTASPAHIRAFYKRWSEIRDGDFDGLIVTGAPVETLDFEEVTYWPELTQIFDWAAAKINRSFYICWAAQAALYHFHGVPKQPLDEKMFGVFQHWKSAEEPALLRGIGPRFSVPVSRHTEVRAEDLPLGKGLKTLAESPESGLCLVEDRARKAHYMFNHLEYDSNTLVDEYLRDREAGEEIALPRNAFPGNDPSADPENTWQLSAQRIFHNWLNEAAATELRDSEAETLTWLLVDRYMPEILDESHSDAVLHGADDQNDQDALPDALREQADLGHTPKAVRVEPVAEAGAIIGLRLDQAGEASGERITRTLLDIPGVRQAAFLRPRDRRDAALAASGVLAEFAGHRGSAGVMRIGNHA